MNRDAIMNMIRSFTQPLMRGRVLKTSDPKATLDDLVPSGQADNFQQTFPFGFVAAPPKGVLAYFLNLFGNSQLPVIFSFLDKSRPAPTGPGEVVLYSKSADGSSVQVKITLGADGVLTINAPSKVKVLCDDVEIGEGTLEKVLNGETFQQRYNDHTHIDSMGGTTQKPIVQSPSGDLSTQVKASQ